MNGLRVKERSHFHPSPFTFFHYFCSLKQKKNMRLNRRVVQAISTALLLLFTAYLSFTTYFSHTHNLHGAIVVHSHPFSKTSETTHSHTLHDFQLMQSQSMLLPFMLFLAGILLNLFRKPIKQHFQTSVSIWQTIIHFVLHHRGPPSTDVAVA